MFRLRHRFVFPRLIQLGDVNFKSWSSRDKTPLYKLDWDAHDEIINEHHQTWNRKCWPAKELPITINFPEPWESKLKGYRYAIPHEYMDAIHESTMKAELEWNQERHFDTNIREMCLKPGISFIEVAFRLLSDCLYSEETNYFLRDPNKWSIGVTLHLIRFWQHQTGSGLVLNHSRFHEVESLLSFKESQYGSDEGDDNQTSELRRFVKFAKEHVETIMVDNEKIQADQKPVEAQPVIQGARPGTSNE